MITTIEDLLKSMLTINQRNTTKFLNNSAETWARIGSQDGFSELNFDTNSEKEEFLKNWIENNEYTNI